MENVQEINFDGSVYGEIIRQVKRNFDELLQFYNFQTEPDLGYESGNEYNVKIIINELNTNLKTKANEGIENE